MIAQFLIIINTMVRWLVKSWNSDVNQVEYHQVIIMSWDQFFFFSIDSATATYFKSHVFKLASSIPTNKSKQKPIKPIICQI